MKSPSSELTVVVVEDLPGSTGKIRQVADFLRNEHFSVKFMEDGTLRQLPTAGDCFSAHPVCVVGAVKEVDQGRRQSDYGPSGRPQASAGIHPAAPDNVESAGWGTDPVRIRFDGDPDRVDDLQNLLTAVTRSSLKPEATAHIRDEISRRGSRLLASTIERYESEGFLEGYAAKWEKTLPFDQLEMFLRGLAPGAHILDAGCGPGHHSRFMASAGFKVTAVDITAAAMRIAATRSTDSCVVLTQADVAHLPFYDGAFDGVWCCATLVHFPIEMLRVPLKEIGRTLKDGGALAFSISVGKLPAIDPDGRFFDSFIDEKHVEAVCEDAGFIQTRTATATSGTTTTGGRQIASWCTVLARRRTRSEVA